MSVNLIAQNEVRGKSAHCGKPGIFDGNGCIQYAPWMSIEAAAHHFAELRAVGKGIVARVSAYETLAVLTNERQQVFHLPQCQPITSAEEEDCVKEIERAGIARWWGHYPFRDPLRVRSDIRVECARFAP